ncbi:putative gibberellin 2-oxidase [Rosellinia necatrix]|uniref:Putative gibberellin 2-oxidase n=1 Tax=Rosellinia necatrix TaxID=77044 RepID=A0A1W2TEL4_ROSNE|nr:putative gibberellin 2-oxidase [Rosellinia necatrix]
MTLKVVDFSKYTAGNDAERAAVAEELLAGFVKDGAVKLTNYGPRQTLAADCLQAARDFFSIPWEEKLAIANAAGPNPQRGFSVVGVEQTSTLWKENLNGHKSWEALRDAREHFDAGPPGDEEFVNRWPEDARHSGFRSQMESLYAELQQISERILSAIEMGLGLPPHQLTSCLKPVSSEIRLNHYPSISLEKLAEGSIKRTWPHTDLGMISLIFQDQIGGLEIEDRSASGPHGHSFVPVAPVNENGPHQVVVVVSNTLQSLTNDVITAGRHQVSVPPTMKNQARGECPERYSAVFFLKAGRATSVAPLSQFVTDARPAAYKNVSALELQQNGTRKLYGISETGSQTIQA